MEDPAAWPRKNKNRLIKQYFKKRNFSSSDPPVAIFMAGIPGAGKTEFTKELVKTLAQTPLRIDMDEIAADIEGYSAPTAYAFREGATIILSRIYDKALQNKKDFIFDGTFGSKNAIKNVRRAQKKGYKVKVYFIYQKPEIAWQFTKDRELVEHRSIDRDGFISSYYNVMFNIKDLQETCEDVTISLIIKDQENAQGRKIEDVKNLFDYTPRLISKQDLESAILN
jgi:UDP-N-acetylglucosamine kinase